ncbi:MAG: hypothetical protein GY804_04365, partial [Alphaproteobacteria bacterium]|nr:hypothetical protein [Alphaproteobacteria bacterium]
LRVKGMAKKDYTTKYIWHTQKDSKTRSSHADRDGKVFEWAHPPEGGHPGQDHNCRCWAEPIFDGVAKDKYCKYISDLIKKLSKDRDKLQQDIIDDEEKIRYYNATLKTNNAGKAYEASGVISDSVQQGAVEGCASGALMARILGPQGALAGCVAGGTRGAAEGGVHGVLDANEEIKSKYEDIAKKLWKLEFTVKFAKRKLEGLNKKIMECYDIIEKSQCSPSYLWPDYSN